MKVLLWVLAALLAAALVITVVAVLRPEPVSAQTYNKAVVASDTRGIWITNQFTVGEGDLTATAVVETAIDTSAAFYINPTCEAPAWVILTVPTDANLLYGAVQFHELQDTMALTYAWGDVIPFYIGGSYRQETFNVGAWNYAKVYLVGTAGGTATIYWRVECGY